MAAAETGSGKTGAFALPVLQIVHEALRTRQAARQAGGGGGTAPSAQRSLCVLNAEDRDAVFAISGDGLRCQARSEQAWGGCRGTVGAFSGRVYYEATVSDEGLCRCVLAGGAWGARGGSPDAGARVVMWQHGQGNARAHAPSLRRLCTQQQQQGWHPASSAAQAAEAFRRLARWRPCPPASCPPARPCLPRLCRHRQAQTCLICSAPLHAPCRVGWSTQAASLDLGTDKHGFGYGGTGKKSHVRQFEDYGEVGVEWSREWDDLQWMRWLRRGGGWNVRVGPQLGLAGNACGGPAGPTCLATLALCGCCFGCTSRACAATGWVVKGLVWFVASVAASCSLPEVCTACSRVVVPPS